MNNIINQLVFIQLVDYSFSFNLIRCNVVPLNCTIQFYIQFPRITAAPVSNGIEFYPDLFHIFDKRSPFPCSSQEMRERERNHQSSKKKRVLSR